MVVLSGNEGRWRYQFEIANCSFYADPEGGTADRLAASECRVTHTALRAVELENLKKPQ